MKKMTCIMCPMGCSLEAERIGGEIQVKGYTCKRGLEYGKQEFIAPKRIVTTLVRLRSGKVVPVKTNRPVAKELITEILREVKNLCVSDSVRLGDILSENICRSGADLVVTKDPDPE